MKGRQNFSINRVISTVSVQVQVFLRVIGEITCVSSKMPFLFHRHNSVFRQNNCSIAKIHEKCPSLVIEKNIQKLTARFAMHVFVIAFTVLFPCMDIDTVLSCKNQLAQWNFPTSFKSTCTSSKLQYS